METENMCHSFFKLSLKAAGSWNYSYGCLVSFLHVEMGLAVRSREFTTNTIRSSSLPTQSVVLHYQHNT